MKILELDLETVDYPPYSPDISPIDYHLFWNLDYFLQGKIFNSQQVIENAFRTFIGSRSPGFYARGIYKLLLILYKSIDAYCRLQFNAVVSKFNL